MNASAPALPREDEVQAKIRKVRAFGRNARVVCAVLFWLPLVGIVIVPLIAVIARTGPGVGAGVVPTDVPSPNDGGTFDVLQALFTPFQLMVCVFLIMGVVIGVWLAATISHEALFALVVDEVLRASAAKEAAEAQQKAERPVPRRTSPSSPASR